MSSTANAVEGTIQTVADAIGKIAPVIEAAGSVLVPGAGPVFATIAALVKGMLAMEPGALALVDQFASSTPPTQDQLDAYAATEQATYEQAMADMAAKLAAP